MAGFRGVGRLALLFALAGCQGAKTFPVKGQVLFKEDSQPLAGGMVVFEPIEAQGNPLASPRGDVAADGSFRLQIPNVGDGAHEGRYRALIVEPLSAKPVIHPRFTDFKTSELEFSVKREPNQFTIYVEKP